MLTFELAVIGYLVVGILSAVVLWLLQLRHTGIQSLGQVDRHVSTLGLMVVVGLAWPISLPLAVYGWAKEWPQRWRSRR